MNRTLIGRRVETGLLPVEEVKRAIAPHVDAAAELRPRLMKAIETFPRSVTGVKSADSSWYLRHGKRAIDLALTSLTYHHIDDRVRYFRALQGDLGPRGRVAHLDDVDVGPPLGWFQTAGHWSDPEALRREMEEAGYHRLAVFDFLPLQSFQIFAPARRDPGPPWTEAPG